MLKVTMVQSRVCPVRYFFDEMLNMISLVRQDSSDWMCVCVFSSLHLE